MLESFEATLPSIELADHGGLDDQVFPAPGRAQSTRQVMRGFATLRLRLGLVFRLGVLGALIWRQYGLDNVVGGRRPEIGVAGCVERNLAE